MTYEDRAAGKLPHVDIAGTDFTVDWRLQELRKTTEPWNNINLKTADMTSDGEHYLFLFSTKDQQEYTFNDQVMHMPENVVLIQIPNELTLDPYAVAIQFGTDPKTLIEDFPIKSDLKAIVRPLSDTNIEILIQQNRQRLNLGNSTNNPDLPSSDRQGPRR